MHVEYRTLFLALLATTAHLVTASDNNKSAAPSAVATPPPPTNATKPSKPPKQPKSRCSAENGPDKPTTLLAELYGPDMTVDAFQAKSDAALDQWVNDTSTSGIHLDGTMLTPATNSSIVIGDLAKLIDFNGDHRVNKAEFRQGLTTLMTAEYHGCSGLCQSVETKLNNCSYFNASAVGEQAEQQQQAKLLLSSCRLGSPDFEKFAKCVKKAKCGKVARCVTKTRHCFFGQCRIADIALIVKQASKMGNSTTDMITTDSAKIHRKRLINNLSGGSLIAASLLVGGGIFIWRSFPAFLLITLIGAILSFFGSELVANKNAVSVGTNK